MERVTGIGGVFIRSAEPERLRAWYADNLGIELTEWGGAVLGDVTWSIFPGDTTYFERESMVNYRVRDLDAMLAQLRAAGVAVDDRVEEMEYGRFGWAYDADGMIGKTNVDSEIRELTLEPCRDRVHFSLRLGQVDISLQTRDAVQIVIPTGGALLFTSANYSSD